MDGGGAESRLGLVCFAMGGAVVSVLAWCLPCIVSLLDRAEIHPFLLLACFSVMHYFSLLVRWRCVSSLAV